jgi:photosystem II stability/assembly factor-like uncharacterized protein
MTTRILSLLTVLLLWVTLGAAAPQKEKRPATGGPTPEILEGLKFRSIGPALMSGRIADVAVTPQHKSEYYVGVSSGGIWKTTNAGTTWTPVFDDENSYSIGCLTIDPANPHVVWAGTGEHNSQRSVSWGDGIYRTEDGGKSWQNMGLKKSEHISKILIDPRDSRVLYVAAQGPLWADGGDRGLYKTTDAGATWKAVLTVSPMTGVTDVVCDRRNPDLLYAASYQRRRHVWTLIDGGPESAVYRSTDAGASWKKLAGGLPAGDVGRIGLAVSPIDPDVVYATVEAAGKNGGFYRSTNRGASWEKRSDVVGGSPQYYQEVYCDPRQFDRVYLMDVLLKVSDDGGKTFRNLGEKSKHVDNHVIWIDPDETDHYLVGGDGGLYESFDRGENWAFKANLPVTQFYRVSVDNALPFYNVLGGTQDNSSQRGPSRTLSISGIANADWVITTGGDGFESAIDPLNPDIVYAQSQHGGLVRYDARSGEETGIKPEAGEGELPLRWNWDSPLLVSPHSPSRIYFCANRVFRSDDRGDSWTPVSPDLSRQIDRNTLPVMGRVWGIDAVAKNASTSFYGNIVAFDESPLKEGLLFAGTDDGLVQVTEDGGKAWRKIDRFPGVPERTYVSRVEASHHAAARIYASFDNHKMGDFAPYLLRSDDLGKSWVSIAGDLPPGGPVYAVVEDHVDPDLIFVGTEFGVFVTFTGGTTWVRLKGGLPTIAVKDIAIQEREDDLVLGTFGRSFYILDNYAPLREVKGVVGKKEAHLFAVKDPLMFIPSRPYGGRGKASLGESFYLAENPPVGAVFTYYLREQRKTKRQQRQDAEKELAKQGKPVPYPTWDELRAEEVEETPELVVTIKDAEGNTVRRLSSPGAKGVNRIVWDLRYPPTAPVQQRQQGEEEGSGPRGALAMPGTYSATLSEKVLGKETELAGPVSFTAKTLGVVTLPAGDRNALVAFQRKVADLQRAVQGTLRVMDESKEKLALMKKAAFTTPGTAGLRE